MTQARGPVEMGSALWHESCGGAGGRAPHQEAQDGAAAGQLADEGDSDDRGEQQPDALVQALLAVRDVRQRERGHQRPEPRLELQLRGGQDKQLCNGDSWGDNPRCRAQSGSRPQTAVACRSQLLMVKSSYELTFKAG